LKRSTGCSTATPYSGPVFNSAQVGGVVQVLAVATPEEAANEIGVFLVNRSLS
jgi:hypothetical protein